ncbi:hypothetical protein LTR37_019997 [Vermiconidia calcicola]|uniref:Uncharacterized protein n=1 Tax=Vermiconidia calcicola TaxID=1690605 RepID=A0ACC3MCQ3_9PEZI|nr:hypothetical protein LTR37_019997 [Vermiconidia calcicola]
MAAGHCALVCSVTHRSSLARLHDEQELRNIHDSSASRACQASVDVEDSAPTLLQHKMCYIFTPYHARCGCWGKSTFSGEPCIRATSQPGLTRGCWDTNDLGVETVDTMCAKCLRRERADSDASTLVGSSSSPRTSASKLPVLMLEGEPLQERSDSTWSTSSSSTAVSSTSSKHSRSSVDDARRILSFLPKSIPKIPRSDSGVSLATADTFKSITAKQNSVSPTEKNLHWRAFDGRGYVDKGDAWP